LKIRLTRFKIIVLTKIRVSLSSYTKTKTSYDAVQIMLANTRHRVYELLLYN